MATPVRSNTGSIPANPLANLKIVSSELPPPLLELELLDEDSDDEKADEELDDLAVGTNPTPRLPKLRADMELELREIDADEEDPNETDLPNVDVIF
jgi:hypothetical protein